MIQLSHLTNTIPVVTENIPSFDSIALGLWVKVGSRDETKDERGITHFIEHLLFKGTKKRTALDIAKEIDSVGGIINAFTSKEYSCFYVKVLKKDIDLGFEILSDIFLNSLFDEKELEKERMVIIEEINMIEDTPDDLIHDLFNKTFFKDNSLGFPITGEKETVFKIKRSHILDYFKKFYIPSNIIISAAGNLSHEMILKKAKNSFGKMVEMPNPNHRETPKRRSSFFFLPKNLEQIHFCLGSKGIPYQDSLRFAAYTLNAIFGGSMSSRLFQEIREKRGLAYSIYSFLSPYSDTGIFGVYGGVKKNSFLKVIELVLKEMEKFSKNGINKQELLFAKDQLKGNLLLGLESSDARMNRLAKNIIFFNKVIPIEESIKQIDAVSIEDITYLAKRFFNPDYFTMAALGPAKEKEIKKLEEIFTIK